MSFYINLKQSNCKNCYKCIRNCAVKSIDFSSGQAQIVEDECVLCGNCFVVCPQNAKEIRNDLSGAKALIQGDAPVFASVAPSFVANYPNVTITAITKSTKTVGLCRCRGNCGGCNGG